MDFRLLGPLEVETGGRLVTPTRPRERAVLAALLLRVGHVVAADELIDAVWGESPPRTARTALQGAVSALRRRIGSGRIETRGSGYRFLLQPEDRYDVVDFEDLVSAAWSEGPSRRSELLTMALAHVRGEPLTDVLVSGTEHEIARLGEARLAAEEARAEADLELGRHLELIPRLERLVAEQPLRESLRSQLMLALYRSGRQADALRVAQDARRVLALELGVQPGPALQRLERAILDHDPDLAGGPPGALESGAADAIERGTAIILAIHGGRLEEQLRSIVADAAFQHHGAPVAAAHGHAYGFTRARDAALAAVAMQRAARRTGSGLSIALGSAETRHLAATVHPGQILCSRGVRDLLRETAFQGIVVRELGHHRLADLAPPQPIAQLIVDGLDAEFPPIRSLDSLATNLPVQPTPLIGRDELLADVVELVRTGTGRLVTLVGPGGTGKTRLASHVAAELLEEAPDGVWFVALEALTDPTLVVPTISAAISDSANGDESLAALSMEIGNRRILLVLDNFEHLLPSAEVVERLLHSAENLRILVTSRVPLKLEGEHTVPVPPLPVPGGDADPESLADLGSVALLVARARAVRPEFAVTAVNAGAVAALCRAVDGLPLAIELAASQLGVLSPGAVVARIDSGLRRMAGRQSARPGRRDALRATIAWSTDLLQPDERALFGDVAIFSGGWTLEAAESVCAGYPDVIGGLAMLVDHSLVHVAGSEAEPRFGMLETIRAHAAGHLDASGRRSDLERRHLTYFESLADAAEPNLRGNPGEWVSRLEHEHDNLRAALDRTTARGDGAAEARLAGKLWRFWYLAGHLAEGRSRLEHALTVHAEASPHRANVLIGAAVMAVNTGRAEIARDHAQEAMALCRKLGDSWGAAYARFLLGAAHRALGDPVGARVAEEASLAAFRSLDDEHTALLVSRNLAGTLELLGDEAGAETLHRDNLRRARAARNGRLEASELGALASIAFDAGRIADATLMLRESLRIHRQLGDRLDTAVDLARAAHVLAISGATAESARLVGALEASSVTLGVRGVSIAHSCEQVRERLGRQLSDASMTALEQEGAALRLADAIDLAVEALGG